MALISLKLQATPFPGGFLVSRQAPPRVSGSHFVVSLKKWLEYNPQVVSYARGDIGPQFAATYRLSLPKFMYNPALFSPEEHRNRAWGRDNAS